MKVQVFSEIGKLLRCLKKTPYGVLPEGEWTDVAERLLKAFNVKTSNGNNRPTGKRTKMHQPKSSGPSTSPTFVFKL